MEESGEQGTGRRTVSASEFKDQCLEIIDEIAETGDEVIITQNGRAVSRLTPYRSRRDGWFGIDRHRFKIVGDIVSPMPEEWFAESDSDPMNDL